MNLLKKVLFVFVFFISGKAYGIWSDTLKKDSLMQTPSIKVMFKGGTPYKTDGGFVVEGTLLFDTDLWTTGPLVMFSSAGSLTFNSVGRVTQGVLSVNVLAACMDNRYREFKRGTRVFFNDKGLVFRGTLHESISVTIDGQVVHSKEDSPIEFYANGGIKNIVPSENFKFTSKEGIKFIIAADSQIKFDSNGNFLEGYLAKKINFVIEGQTIYMSLGQCVRFSDEGNLLW